MVCLCHRINPHSNPSTDTSPLSPVRKPAWEVEKYTRNQSVNKCLEASHHQAFGESSNDSSNNNEHLLCSLGSKRCAEHFLSIITPSSTPPHLPTGRQVLYCYSNVQRRKPRPGEVKQVAQGNPGQSVSKSRLGPLSDKLQRNLCHSAS